jgi:large subunit ribosomal protein L31
MGSTPSPGRNAAVKQDIHPKYVACKVICGCGNTFQTRSTKAEIHVEICSVCHPYYTGKQKFVDTAGRIEKFQRKFAGKYGSNKTGGMTTAPSGVPGAPTSTK